jgi:hypothetical protein
MKRATAGDPTTTWKTPSSTAAATKPSPGPLKKKERMELKEAAEKQGDRKGGVTQISSEGQGWTGLWEGSDENLDRT